MDNHTPALTEQQIIKTAVDRFLGWTLPPDFAPDGGISFDGQGRQNGPFGTNLFTDPQARAMFEHCLKGLLAAAPAAQPTDEPVSDHALMSRWHRILHAEGDDEAMFEVFRDEVGTIVRQVVAAQPHHFVDANGMVGAQSADNLDLDGTEAAHPAWWRGSDYTVERMCDQLEKLLDGAPVTGQAQQRWQRIRERVAALVAAQPAAPQGQPEPVGHLTVSHFRGLENAAFDYAGNLPDGDYQLYTIPPAPSAGEQP